MAGSMVDKDVVLAKTASIQKCLKRIKEATGLDPARIDDQDIQDIFVLNLQRAIQSAIDLAVHVSSSEGLGLSDTIRGYFVLLEREKIIGKTLSQKMQSMVGFRNIAIHDYQALDMEILRAILGKHLRDLEQFYTAIITHFDLVPKLKKPGAGSNPAPNANHAKN
jgi:uncharacterized protein YutE (UPF0331/DUF86 family)